MLNLQTVKFKLRGVSPLIQHNRQLADPRCSFVKQMKEITAKRKKTEADHEALSRLEYMGGLYSNDDGPYVPAEWLESAIRDGAKTFKQGKTAVASIFCTEPGYKLQYKGPRTADELFNNTRFVDARMVKVQQSRILRTRPIFPEWSLEFALQINPEVLSQEHIARALDNAGALVGLGDYRPKYGRFVVESQEIS